MTPPDISRARRPSTRDLLRDLVEDLLSSGDQNVVSTHPDRIKDMRGISIASRNLPAVTSSTIAGVAATAWKRLDVPSPKSDTKTWESGKRHHGRRGVRVRRGEFHIWMGTIQTSLQLLVETIPLCTLDFEVILQLTNNLQHGGMQRKEAPSVGHSSVSCVRG